MNPAKSFFFDRSVRHRWPRLQAKTTLFPCAIGVALFILSGTGFCLQIPGAESLGLDDCRKSLPVRPSVRNHTLVVRNREIKTLAAGENVRDGLGGEYRSGRRVEMGQGVNLAPASS